MTVIATNSEPDTNSSACGKSFRGFLDRRALAAALLLQMVGELYDQDAVLADQAAQGDEPDHGI